MSLRSGQSNQSPPDSSDEFVADDDCEFDDDYYDPPDPGGLEEICDFFSEARLQQLVGTSDVESVTFLEVRINAEEIVMRDLGVRLPNLTEMKLNNSNITSFRDLGTAFKNLSVLWLARSNVQELDGISGLVSIKEIYLAFNEIKDLSALVGCDGLEVLDLEGNVIDDMGEVSFLSSCTGLTTLTLEGNPIANTETYRQEVLKALPQIEVLDYVDRDEGANKEEDFSSGISAEGFASNLSVDINDDKSDEERDNDDDMRPRKHISPSKKTEKDIEELMLVHHGIKHARTGFDDVEFVSLEDCEDQRYNRPSTARQSMANRPQSASLRPGSSLSGGSRQRSATSPADSESGENGEGRSGEARSEYRPRSRDSGTSGGQLRPPTASSGGSGRRPTSASISIKPGTGASSMRPATSISASMHERPRTATLGFGQRLGTAGGSRAGTAAGSRPSTAGGDQAWAFRRSARSSKGGPGAHDDDALTVASDLTYGAQEV